MKSTFSKLDFFQILGWAFYLACSWTWCIGMFLPVLLVRDYGSWGWAVFAIPNIVGACAMPYVLKKPSVSVEMIEKHKIACTTFSIITILFQIYFIGWISTVIPNIFMVITIAILLLVSVLGSIIDDNQKLSAFIVWILSLICFIVVLNIVPIEKIDLFKSGNLIHNTDALLYLTPVCVFGFLLCPYLDLTFHKAIQSTTSENSKLAFTIGFCFMFLLIIAFTFFYTRPMANVIEGIPYFLKDQSQLPLTYVYFVVFHMVIQSGFTIILHLRSVFPMVMIEKYKGASLLFLALSIMVYLLPIIFNAKNTFLGITINDIGYRSFMAFYSLVVPAYVFVFMLPKHKKSISLNNYNLLVWIVVVLFALPFYAVAFLGVKWNLEFCLLIGLAVVLCSRALIKYEDVDS